MTERKDLLVWIDIETTGLDVEDKMQGIQKHKILEIGMHITDSNYNIIDPGFEIVIHHKKEDVEKVLSPYVKEMHEKNGLLKRVESSLYNLKDAEQMMIFYLKQYNVEPKSSPICGNSVTLDANFLNATMPEFMSLLHYRKIDVSSLKEIAARRYPEVASLVQKKQTHRGLDDIKESISELKIYEEHMFKPSSLDNVIDTARKPKLK